MRTHEPDLASPAIVSLADEEAVRKILSTTVLDLWKVVNNLTRLRPSKRERYRVAIFGSARAQPGTFVYEEVKRAAAAFAAMGCDIVTGGGPPRLVVRERSRPRPRRTEDRHAIALAVRGPETRELAHHVPQAKN